MRIHAAKQLPLAIKGPSRVCVHASPRSDAPTLNIQFTR